MTVFTPMTGMDVALAEQGNHSEKQGQESIETSKTRDNECHCIATVHAFAAQLPKMPSNPDATPLLLQLSVGPATPGWLATTAASASCLTMSRGGTSTTAPSVTCAAWGRAWGGMCVTACSATAAWTWLSSSSTSAGTCPHP